ncbi:septation protein SepH [Gordonia caeni]|uniref:Septation protein SepH n=1 Tax=Gordonia caeni TaxID=1007097 RepID=A0ABP7PML0_9ACTN
MRELEVLRVESDGRYVVCIDRETDEHFRIRADDDLRAAARADTTELGQMPVAGDAALRPREIQARIRAGASVDELAEIAGVSTSRIERYAHPVLLERSRAAELARASHPLGMDGPSLSTLGELVAECLVLRGGVPADARWDSWKGDDGHWMVQLSYYEGSTENFAHWRFQPGTHGGTTDPIDQLAVELTDPETARAARRTRLAAVPTRRAEPRREVRPDGYEEVTVDADSLIGAQQAQPRRAQPPLADVLDLQYSTTPAAAGPTAAEPPAAEPTVPEPGDAPSAAQHGAHEADDPAEPGSAEEPARPVTRHRAKRAKPAVPAWEDVLLGVRSHPDD